MRTKNSSKIFGILLIFTGLASCQYTDRSDNTQHDGAPIGADSLRMKESLNTANNVTQKSKVNDDDAAFMDTAAIGGMMEVDLGRLALEKSANTEVKKFAALMVADHTRANRQLKAIAVKLEPLLPMAYPAEVKTHMDAMKKLKGKEFDAHYMAMMVNDHVKTLDLFRFANSLSSEIKDFVVRTLPVLEKHHQMAITINTSLK